MTPRQLDFPYYSLRDGFNSTLLLVSDSPKPTDVFVVVHGSQGQTILAPPITIQPGAKVPVDVGKLLVDAGADVLGDFAEGSVSVLFSGTIMPVAAQLTMTDPARSLILESEMVDNAPGLNLLPAQLNGVWWGLGGGREARIMVTNTGPEAVTADLFLDVLGDRHATDPLSFGPHETKVLSVAKLLGDVKFSPAQAPEGGITIVPRGTKPTLIAQGKITDATRGFSTTLNFPDPSLERTSAFHASGVPIGTPSADSPFAGTGTFVPHVIVRNLTGSPQSVTITVEYPGEKEPQRTGLPPFLVASYSTQDVSLDAAFGALPLPLPFCSIGVQYTGAPGSLIGEITSIEQKGDLVIDSRATNEGNTWAQSGGHPWHLDAETDSILFLTNMGEKECPIALQVNAEGVRYYLAKVKLKPHETQAIDLRKLRDEQKPDLKKSTIPPGATDGSVLWGRIDNVPVMGRLVVLKRRQGMANNYDCGVCQCPLSMTYYPLYMDPDSAYLLVAGTQHYYATATYEDCNWNLYYFDVTNASSWSSSDWGVATVAVGLVTGAGGGTSTITANVSGAYWIWDPNWWCYILFYVPTSGNATANVKPNITGISPPRGLIGATTSVTISGSGFGANPTVNAGSGITVTRNSFSDTQIQASFAVASNAPSGNHSVTVSTTQGTSNSVNFYVQVPNHLQVVSDINGPLSGCTNIIGRLITFRVVDPNSNTVGIVPVKESFSNLSSNSCGNGSPQPSPCANTDNAQSEFTDTITVNCNSVGGSCGYTLTDQWQWCPTGQSAVALGTLNETVHADQITVNGVATPNSIASGTNIYP